MNDPRSIFEQPMHTFEQPKNRIDPPSRVELYQQALVLLAREQDPASWATREALPEEWTATQYSLGAAYQKRIRGNRAQNLERRLSTTVWRSMCSLVRLSRRTGP